MICTSTTTTIAMSDTCSLRVPVITQLYDMISQRIAAAAVGIAVEVERKIRC